MDWVKLDDISNPTLTSKPHSSPIQSYLRPRFVVVSLGRVHIKPEHSRQVGSGLAKLMSSSSSFKLVYTFLMPNHVYNFNIS